MELINDKYVKVNKADIFKQIIIETDKHDNYKVMYWQELLGVLLEYEKKTKEHIHDIHIRKDSIYIQEILKGLKLTIKRQTLLNASLFAMYHNDIDKSQKLNLWISKTEVLPFELGELVDYVLEHSMDINEYFDGEKERIIYNDTENKLEKGYIFQSEKNVRKRSPILQIPSACR